jgi:hypothetical protein
MSLKHSILLDLERHCSFKENIRGYYQRISTEESNQHAKEKMKDFLERNNFSGDSDPIFSALPDDITTRRYVALHPELHQLHLFLLSREHDVENDVDLNDDKVKQPFAKPRCGDFWYYTMTRITSNQMMSLLIPHLIHLP